MQKNQRSSDVRYVYQGFNDRVCHPIAAITETSILVSLFKSNFYCEDRVPVDIIYGCPILKWAAETWLINRVPGSWWRHRMEAFSALLAICAGNSPVSGEFPTQRPVTRSFVYFDLRPNKWLSKQSWGWWFETPSRPLWRHRNDIIRII